MYYAAQDKKEMWQDDKILRAFGIAMVVTALVMPVLMLVLSVVASYVTP